MVNKLLKVKRWDVIGDGVKKEREKNPPVQKLFQVRWYFPMRWCYTTSIQFFVLSHTNALNEQRKLNVRTVIAIQSGQTPSHHITSNYVSFSSRVHMCTLNVVAWPLLRPLCRDKTNLNEAQREEERKRSDTNERETQCDNTRMTLTHGRRDSNRNNNARLDYRWKWFWIFFSLAMLLLLFILLSLSVSFRRTQSTDGSGSDLWCVVHSLFTAFVSLDFIFSLIDVDQSSFTLRVCIVKLRRLRIVWNVVECVNVQHNIMYVCVRAIGYCLLTVSVLDCSKYNLCNNRNRRIEWCT